MKAELHERARRLIDARQVEGISSAEGEWLEAHLAECAECGARARSTEHALQFLGALAVKVDPAVVAATQARVQLRARQLREKQARMRSLWAACGLSWLFGALTAPLLWEAIAWLGRRFDLSQAVWVVTFAICWAAPATVVGGVIAWRHSRIAGEEKGEIL